MDLQCLVLIEIKN